MTTAQSFVIQDAEEAVLGAVLMQPSVMATPALAALSPAEFEDPRRQHIFRAMIDLAAASTVDPLTVAHELDRHGRLEAAGGKDYLGHLLYVVPTAANVEYHAAIVLKSAKRRQMAASFDQWAQLARDGKSDPADLALRVQHAMVTLARSERSSRFALLDDVQIAALGSPTWLIEGVLPSHGLAVLIAAPKSFKSFVALDWSCHIALGLDWHGRSVRQGSVVYVYAEGVTGIQHRVAAWKQFHGLQGERLGVYFLPRRVTLNADREATELLAEIQRTVDPAPVLIIIDTVARCLDGNENQTEDMSAFVRGCDILREGTGAAVLPVHHKGHGAEDRGRGSTALEAAADTVILCSRDEERLTLENKWMKDAQEFPPLALEAVEIGPSLVLKPSGVAGGGLKGQRLRCLTVLHENYTAEHGATYKAWHEASGLGASSFNKSREWLKANAYVTSMGGKWKMTDGGRLALRSTYSTATPPLHSGAQSMNSTPKGGCITTPSVELDPTLPLEDDRLKGAA